MIFKRKNMKVYKILLVIFFVNSLYGYAKDDDVLFKPDPSFFNTRYIAQENLMEDIAKTCQGLDECYASSDSEEALSYQKQCVIYRLDREIQKINDKYPGKVIPLNKKSLLNKNDFFSIFIERSIYKNLTKIQFITESNNVVVDSFILYQELPINKSPANKIINQEKNDTSKDESYQYIDKNSWEITTIGIFHKECDQISPVYKKQIGLAPETGFFFISYFDFWSYLYNEQAKYHLDFSVDKPDIKLVSISKLEALDNKNIDCKTALSQTQNDSDKTLCKATSIYRQANQVKLYQENMANYLETQPNILKNTYTYALNQNQKAWIDYQNSTCLFPLLDKLPQYEKDTYILFERLSQCIEKISISNQDQLQRQLAELQKKDSSFFNLQDNLVVNEQMNKLITEAYHKTITKINTKQSAFSLQSKALLEKSKTSFEQYRNSSCLLEAASYKHNSPDFLGITQKCINRLNTNYIDALNNQREIY